MMAARGTRSVLWLSRGVSSHVSGGNRLLTGLPQTRRKTVNPAPRQWNIPNMLTSSRIILSPGVAWLVVADQPELAVAGMSVLAATDFLDGFLARRWHMTTPVGAVLDPLADKVLVNTVMVALAAKALVPIWVCGVVAGRDLLLVGGALYIRVKNFRGQKSMWRSLLNPNVQPVRIRVLWLSKLNTSLQFLLIAYCVACLIDERVKDDRVHAGLVAATTATTVLSGGRYLYYAVARGVYNRL